MAKIKFENGVTVNFDGEPTQKDIEEVAARLGVPNEPSGAAAEKEPSILQGAVQLAAKPFLKTTTSAATAGAGIIGTLAGVDEQKMMSTFSQGVDYGYFGKVKPIGAPTYQYKSLSPEARKQLGPEGFVKAFGRTAANFMGTSLEIASYPMAPGAIAAGGGFWAAVKAAAPVSGLFAAGTGLQTFGETGSAGAGAAQGAMDFAGASLGFGLFHRPGQYFRHFGATALANKQMREAGQWFNGFLEKAWATMPDEMKNAYAVPAEKLSGKAQSVYNALKKEFDVNWKTTADIASQAAEPRVADPNAVTFRFERSVGEALGDKFRAANKMYDNVKADSTVIGSDNFNYSKDVLGRYADNAPTMVTEAGSNIMLEMQYLLKQDVTMKQVLDMHRRILSETPRMSVEERQYANEMAAALYSDAKKFLSSSDGNKELLSQWNEAYRLYEEAQKTYGDSLLQNIKSSGNIDNILDASLGKNLDKKQQEIIINALRDNPQETQDLFISAVLDRARRAPTKEDAAKTIREFLDTWDNGSSRLMANTAPEARLELMQSLVDSNSGQPMRGFLTPEQSVMLDDIATFYEGNFSDFAREMRVLTGVSKETAQDLYDQQNRLRVQEMITDGRLDELDTAFKHLSNDPEFVDAVSRLGNEEKQALAISMTKDMYDSNRSFLAARADGSVEATRDMTQAFIKTYEKIAGGEKTPGSQAAYELFSPEQMADMKQAYDVAKSVEAVGGWNSVPKERAKIVLHGVLATLYGGFGPLTGTTGSFVAGAGHHATQAATIAGRQKVSYETFMQSVDDLVESGVFKPNTQYNVGEFITAIAQYPVGQPTAQFLQAGTTGEVFNEE